VFGDTLVNIAKNPQSYRDAYRGTFGTIVLPIYEKADGISLKGGEPGWGDFVTASSLPSLGLLYDGGSREWKYIETWHEGGLVKLIKDQIRHISVKCEKEILCRRLLEAVLPPPIFSAPPPPVGEDEEVKNEDDATAPLPPHLTNTRRTSKRSSRG